MKVMIDIETLSTEHNAVVLSIGAVKFTEEEVTEDTFYRELDRESQEADRHVSKRTLEWWSTQENPPPKGDYDPEQALQELSYFCGDCEEFWFRGPTFDAVILENLADQYHVSVPWKFWQICDARTFDSLQMPRHDKKKVSHNALEDAIEQAKDVVHVFDEIDRTNIMAWS
jgi:hypothetical protein